ncbi:MAG TPA: mechanosensitive ion channel domain-containing protein [Desulfuromonadales bacterium]|nr:mechanosensitive ion channel domain-containing protein [Desulfuromonadales bacterium]
MGQENIIFLDVLTNKVILSLAFVLVLIGGRLILLKWISRKGDLPAEQKRRWLIRSRNLLILLVLAGLVIIWVYELKTLAVSLLAVAVALVLATKELILCFSGSVLRHATKAFDLGDRVEVSGMRGEVMDINFFGTSLREVGPGKLGQQYTGKSIVVPHSLLLNNAVINETFTGDFQLHLFTVPWKIEDDWLRAEALLLEAAEQESAALLEKTRKHMKSLQIRHGIEPPTIEPKVTLEIPEPGCVNFKIRVPVASDRLSRIEQAIIRRFLVSFYEKEAEGE